MAKVNRDLVFRHPAMMSFTVTVLFHLRLCELLLRMPCSIALKSLALYAALNHSHSIPLNFQGESDAKRITSCTHPAHIFTRNR
jgi:hypothetical protein